MNTTPNDAVTQIASNAASSILNTVTSVLPVLVPIFAAFWGIRFALSKLGVNKKAGL